MISNLYFSLNQIPFNIRIYWNYVKENFFIFLSCSTECQNVFSLSIVREWLQWHLFKLIWLSVARLRNSTSFVLLVRNKCSSIDALGSSLQTLMPHLVCMCLWFCIAWNALNRSIANPEWHPFSCLGFCTRPGLHTWLHLRAPALSTTLSRRSDELSPSLECNSNWLHLPGVLKRWLEAPCNYLTVAKPCAKNRFSSIAV